MKKLTIESRNWIKSQKFLLTLGVMSFLLIAVSNSWAERTIYGRIRLADDTPAKGVAVIAWDSDGFGGGKDDFMCNTITDSSGHYRMTYYKDSPWDTRVPGSTSFRPDIYLTIHTTEVGTLPVKKTGVYSNWRMSRNLGIDVKLPAIMGIITGAPASGVIVEAFDSDGWMAGRDDPIAKTRTEANGHYMMLYGGKHYDSTPPSPGPVAGYLVSSLTFPGIDALVQYIVTHGWEDQMHRRWTSWRPDIYIKVYANPVRQSRVYENWPHRNTLIINMNIEHDTTPTPSPPCPSGQRCCGAVIDNICRGQCYPTNLQCP